MQKQERKGKEYSVILLVDNSGSMSMWDLIEPAADTAVYLGESLQKAKIPFAVIGYNCFVAIHKKWNETIDKKDLHKKIVSSARGGSLELYGEKAFEKQGLSPDVHAHYGNHDLLALEMAKDELVRRKGRKILITISDGRPTCDFPRSCKYDQKKQDITRIRAFVESMSRAGIMTMGIGLENDTVKQIYPVSKVFNEENLATFPDYIIQTLRQEIKRG